jgi:hypothetical protein
MLQDADVSNESSWGGVRFTSPSESDFEDFEAGLRRLQEFLEFLRGRGLGNNCVEMRQLVEQYLSQGYKIELIAEGRSRGGDYDGPLLGDNLSGSVTSFCLQTPLAIDDCSVEDLISNVTTGIEVATATPVYQLYVDPTDDRTLRFPPNTNLTDWPGRDYQGLSNYWDTVLDHEKNLQIDNKTTYYGDLSSKNKGGFPRYAGLSIPTYQASSFVSLFNSLSAEERIYPHLVEMIGQNSRLQPYEINFQYYDITRGWTEHTRLDFAIPQTGLSEHLEHLQGLAGESPDIFDVIEDEVPEEEQGLGFDFPDFGLDRVYTPVNDCPPFADRIRAMLAAEANVNLEEDIIDAQLNSPRGLFLGMIGGDLEYTEPLFYKVTRDRLVGLDIERGNIGHLMVKNGLPVLGGQPIFHANKAENSYFTLEDRFVDYGDSYQYNVEAYTVVMKVNYETNQVTREQVKCLPNVNVDRIEQKLGDGVTYSLAIFKPEFDIIKVPYVHTDYQRPESDEFNIDDRRLGVALPPITITDKPPIAPGLSVIPYRGISDKMLLMFDLQTDKIIEDYIYLTTEERGDFQSIHRRQRQQICDLCENSVEFQSEGGDIEKVQVFRSIIVPEIVSETNPSQLYQDTFGSEPHKEIMVSEGSAFVDDIVPNTKYFYMIRAKDKNGHFSNPSNIYRVEMVEEDGLIFSIIELYTPKMKNRGVKHRKMAKHLEIKPALLMTEPNWSADDDNNISWKIGSREDSILETGTGQGRQFKICLTSLDTGRKIEIDVNFGKEEIKVDETDDRDIGE